MKSYLENFGGNQNLLDLWEHRTAALSDIMTSKISLSQQRKIIGQLGIHALYNPDHHKKRPPSVTRSGSKACKISIPYDSSQFNFTKISEKEILFQFIEQKEKEKYQLIDASSITKQIPSNFHLAIVNISPIVLGHFLIIFDPYQGYSQFLKDKQLMSSLRFLLDFGDPHLCLGYNSVGAWSSVNHLHFQGLPCAGSTVDVKFPILNQKTKELFTACCKEEIKITVSFIPSWPCQTIVIEQRDDDDDDDVNSRNLITYLAEFVGYFLNEFQRSNIPFNLLIGNKGHKIWLFPRKFQEENQTFSIAIVELAGALFCNSLQLFKSITEKEYIDVIEKEVSLTKERIFQLLDAIQVKCINSWKIEKSFN